MKKYFLLKLFSGMAFAISLSWLGSSSKAQEFYHFPASFFNPVANFYQSEDNLDITDMLAKNDDFEIIAFLLKNDPTLTSLRQEDVTFLAPTDKAFQALPSEIRVKLLQYDNLSKFLEYHTIAQKIQEEDIQNRQVKTISGDSVTITGFPIGNKFGVKLNDAVALEPLPASNGVVVPLDRVLIPPGF